MEKLRELVYETLKDITSDSFDFELDGDGDVDVYW